MNIFFFLNSWNFCEKYSTTADIYGSNFCLAEFYTARLWLANCKVV